MGEIYLDNNATTKPLPEVVEAVAQAMSAEYGNPSSPHGRGAVARQILQASREQVAGLVGCDEGGIIFTSGGTEANNVVLQSILRHGASPRLVTTAIEHSSVLSTAQFLEESGVKVDYLEVDSLGRLSPDTLREALRCQAYLVSIQWANSETGVIQPISELSAICKDCQVPLHVDAAQAVGRQSIEMRQLPVSYLTFTAHKIHGPQGVGAIAAKDDAFLKPLTHGGEQESTVRPGTENLPGIAGFGCAAKMRASSIESSVRYMQNLRDVFERRIADTVPEAKVNGDMVNRVVNSSNIQFPCVDGMAMMARLDGAGIRCSLASACVSSRPEPSHVLLAMGYTEAEAYSSLRFSFSVLNTEDEAVRSANEVRAAYERLAGLGRSSGLLI